MLRTQFIEAQLRQGRLDAKTLDSAFRRRIEEGANCPPFVSQAILDIVKDVFGLVPDDPTHQSGWARSSSWWSTPRSPLAGPWTSARR